MIKTVIFDWDGVIVDSMPFVAQGIQETAALYGVHVSLDEVLDGYFQPRDAYYRSLGIDTTDMDELNKRHRAANLKYQQPAPIFPEVTEVLQFLKTHGLTLGIASTAESTYIIERLADFGLSDIFETKSVVGGEIAKEDKLNNFLHNHNTLAQEFLYVGDLPSDVKAAHAVGVQAAGIERREAARRKLGALNPEYLFASLDELKFVIEKQS